MTTFVNSKGVTVERQRLIRYTNLSDAEHPNLLSAFDREKNLQMIDQRLSVYLSRGMLEQLEMSEIPATMLVEGKDNFQPYNQ